MPGLNRRPSGLNRWRHDGRPPQWTTVLDGAGWHISKSLIVPDNITLMPLPPYSPELNPVENLWQYLRQNHLANRVFDSYDDIVDAC